MVSQDKPEKSKVMTPEKLRSYWFSDRSVPFWDYDPEKLTLGLEVEYFIAKIDGDRYQLATKNQYLEVVNHLVTNAGYSERDFSDQPGRVSKDTDAGFIAIKPDFAWHILEIALPPRANLEDIRSLLLSTFADVDAALSWVGLQRLNISCLPNIPDRIELVELDRLTGFVSANGEPPVSNFDVRIFPALIAATHVHINCSNEASLSVLPALYSMEAEALRRFTRATSFRGETVTNVRNLLYEHSLGKDYLLRTVPDLLPYSLDSYSRAFNLSKKLFPFDPFFPARDLSYIRPTRYGTFEFRSACSFIEIDSLLQIASFRKQQVIYAMRRGSEVRLSVVQK